MNKRFVGKTGIAVSEVGLGCEHLQGLPKEQVKAVCEAALNSGINIFDVFMSEPNVRDFIGEAIKDRRENVYIQGHIGAAWKDGQYNRTTDVKECQFFLKTCSHVCRPITLTLECSTLWILKRIIKRFLNRT